MKTYKVSYSYDGYGYCTIKARNEEEAREKYYSGEFIDDEDDGTNYYFDKAEEVII